MKVPIRSDQCGFTLIEAIFSITLLGIVFSTVSSLIISSSRGLSSTRQTQVALFTSQACAEKILAYASQNGAASINSTTICSAVSATDDLGNTISVTVTDSTPSLPSGVCPSNPALTTCTYFNIQTKISTSNVGRSLQVLVAN